MNDPPLVSCIMPTRDRRSFVARAIEYFRSQDYPNRELIVVDDGDDHVDDLVPTDARFRYVRLDDVRTVGFKRNVACDRAAGAIIAHWDDDDWYAPKRLTYQVEALLAADADVCGLADLVFYDPDRAKAWRYVYPAEWQPWVHGGTMCYRRSSWERHPFADINVGQDELFVWSAEAGRVLALPDRSIYVATVHPGNTSQKVTDGPLWRPLALADVRSIVADPSFFQADGAHGDGPVLGVAPALTTTFAPAKTRPVRNVYACLTHESPECVIDLVRNLHHTDPGSTILLYNGGSDPTLFDDFPFHDHAAVVVPAPRQMAWGRLHDFALDSMRFALATVDFDTLTIVDSDQMAVRRGYRMFIAPSIDGRSDVGLLANSTATQVLGAAAPPALAALEEVELWRPFLRRFRRGEELFPRWCFWPSTVFTRDAARELTRLFETDVELRQIMERTQIWATEEVILPTLVALLGFESVQSPCSFDYVKYREPYTVDQLTRAMARPDVYWVHPVPRRYDDPLRATIRRSFDDYRRDPAGQGARTMTDGRSATVLLPTLPVLERMRPIEGWLEDEEADLLLAAAAASLRRQPTHPILEIGSYCGRSTVVLGSAVLAIAPATRVFAIDPHDGTIGALDRGITTGNGTLERFRRNVAEAGVDDVVTIVQRYSYDVEWEGPIGMLFLDGLHDFANVARDFRHFARFLAPGSLIAFHDYADYYPGVVAFVDLLIGSGDYQRVAQARSMMIIEPVTGHSVVTSQP